MDKRFDLSISNYDTTLHNDYAHVTSDDDLYEQRSF